MTTSPYIDHVLDHVTDWPGVDPVACPDGTVELYVGDSLAGHVYDTGLVDLAFDRAIRDQLLTEGRADRHHREPDSGWVSAWLRAPQDIRDVRWLLRLAYLCHLRDLPSEQTRTLAPEVDVGGEVDRLGLSTALRVLVTRPSSPMEVETPDTAQSA